jgi:hypothetical protein
MKRRTIDTRAIETRIFKTRATEKRAIKRLRTFATFSSVSIFDGILLQLLWKENVTAVTWEYFRLLFRLKLDLKRVVHTFIKGDTLMEIFGNYFVLLMHDVKNRDLKHI